VTSPAQVFQHRPGALLFRIECLRSATGGVKQWQHEAGEHRHHSQDEAGHPNSPGFYGSTLKRKPPAPKRVAIRQHLPPFSADALREASLK
jgi:hypothetical protein